MLKKLYCIILTIAIWAIGPDCFSQAQTKYWIQFTNKKISKYTLNKPQQFLSQRALNKRTKYNIPITDEDLPVSQKYIDSLKSAGYTILNTSKWFNAVTIATTDTNKISQLHNWSFIKKIQKTYSPDFTKGATNNKFDVTENKTATYTKSEIYGQSSTQIDLVKGIFLHQKGFKGNGLQIAILDAGFYNANIYNTFDSLYLNNRILGTRDFVNPGGDVYAAMYHGMSVLSVMGGNIPGEMIGTAPDASFWLLRTEDANTENPIEEDNWVSGAEFADSVGADIINSSLGYSTFDNPADNMTYEDMNGRTARISIAANIAASKGILVVSSAGNSGNDPWRYISAPADADNILAVGAVDFYGEHSAFSSLGPSSDGRVKPDIAAMGSSVYLVNSSGNLGNSSGTSFSAPIISGMAACLWQAFPDLTNKEIIKFIKLSGNRYYSPDSLTGYGIANFEKAYSLINFTNTTSESKNIITPNPFYNYLCINLLEFNNKTVNIDIYTTTGKKTYSTQVSGQKYVIIEKGLTIVNPGILIAKLTGNSKTVTIKIVKQ